ncbi:tachylectin-related carbohydrate-binding protein [Streptomyces sp. 35G-GA-8]|uniref:tachylectin-related carbohydrate-binding protein n=1 Tax=Streptomyces sp. 35G-GA-8 TaxID=2939434 RepID=UPI00201F317C|nr:tachylectin-related carbohydrate-binding protein [Streptomyces sp. 35G-GA-8]MCL7380696.1 tachylectin-related carbohydrate-binding protein [Streptomyces sp. 35G-GA-8]
MAASLPLLVAVEGTAHAAEAASCTATGPTYAVNKAGELLRYDMPTPLTGGSLSSPGTIDTGWSGYGRVLAGKGAQFFGIKADGLYLSHRVASTGTWDIHHKKISDSFGWLIKAEDRDQVTVDRAGRLWVVDNTGQLRSWQYDTATSSWTANSGKILDQGWERYNLIVAADDGVLYGRATADGKLYRSRYDFTSQRWTERHVVESLADWNQYTKGITSIGGDTLLGINDAGQAKFYRFDENIRDFPVYNKEVGTGGWQNYPNVTGAPDACRVVNSHTPASPSVALETYSRASVMQSSSGSLEYAYTDNIGRLVHGRQTDPSDFNGVQWTTISGNEAFSGQPSLGEHTDGRVVVTGHNTSGSVWQRNQVAKSSADWGSWINLAGAMAQHAVTAKTPSGLLVQFSVDANGAPWYRIQQRANVDFMGWMPLSGSGLSGPLTAVTVRDGIQIFGKNSSGVLSTALFKEAGTLSSWTTLGAQAVTGTPAVVVYPGYRLRIFGTDGAGNVVTTTQATEGGAYGAWSTIDGVKAQGSPSAVISPQTGITEIVVRGTDGTIHNTGETVQGSGTWRAWQQPSEEAAATEPTAFTFTNASGPTWAYSFRTADNQTRVYRVDLGFSRMARSAQGAADSPVDAPAFTGRTLPAPPAK